MTRRHQAMTAESAGSAGLLGRWKRWVTGAQSYVHHCHIVEHDDNETMWPFTVTP